MKYLATRPSVNGGLFDVPASVDELFSRFWNLPVRTAADTGAWQPPVDIVETPRSYVLKVELPGIAIESIDVTVSGDTLLLRGEKPREERLEAETQTMRERAFGKFERSFTFPTTISGDKVEAQAKHGVLTITVHKADEVQPRKIAIRGE